MNTIEKIKKYGISEAFRYLAKKFLGTSVYRAHYLRLNIDIDEVNEKLKDFNLDVKELTYEDFMKGDPTVFHGNKMVLYKQRFADNTYKAYGIIENDRLVYSTWISFHRMGMSVETHAVYLADNEGYLEDSYCDPIARGRGLHSRMNNYRIKKIFEAGRNRVIAIVQEGNTPAFKVQYKSGLEEIGTFYHGKIFGIKFNTLKKEKFDNK